MQDMKREVSRTIRTEIQNNNQEIMCIVERRINQEKSTTISNPRTTPADNQQQPIATSRNLNSPGFIPHVQVHHTPSHPFPQNDESLSEDERTQD